jgi:hypothetical protein
MPLDQSCVWHESLIGRDRGPIGSSSIVARFLVHFATRLLAIAILKTRALDGSRVLVFTAKPLHSKAAGRDIEASAEEEYHEPVRSLGQHALGNHSIRLGGEWIAETLPRAGEIASNQMRGDVGGWFHPP